MAINAGANRIAPVHNLFAPTNHTPNPNLCPGASVKPNCNCTAPQFGSRFEPVTFGYKSNCGSIRMNVEPAVQLHVRAV